MKTIIKIWKSKHLIFEGIWYSIFRTAYIEKIAAERATICNTCPFHDVVGDKCLVLGTQPCCGKCGCSDQFKLRSLSSSCGDQENPRWHAVMSQKKEDRFIKNLKQ